MSVGVAQHRMQQMSGDRRLRCGHFDVKDFKGAVYQSDFGLRNTPYDSPAPRELLQRSSGGEIRCKTPMTRKVSQTLFWPGDEMAFRKHESDPTSDGISTIKERESSTQEQRHGRQESHSAMGAPSPSQHRPALPISSLLSPAPHQHHHHHDRPSPASGSTSTPTSDDLSDGELPPSPFRPPQGSPKIVPPVSNMKAVARPYRSHSTLS